MYTRRKLLQAMALMGLAIKLPNSLLAKNGSLLLQKTIPSTGASIPAVGMGTWITFDHSPERINLNKYVAILEAFFAGGGQLIDSSPMYGNAQQLLGAVLPQVNKAKSLFAATKVWIPGQRMGIEQMNQSIKLWGLDHMDLMQVHNLLDWQQHLTTLNQWKAEGKIKYTGVTTSHGRRHSELIDLIRSHRIDFVQFTYNIQDREAENYLLPLAQDRGVAVIINRPFQTGGLFTRVAGKQLPDWASEIGCDSWAQFFLKFVISHPAVTCAIPATSQLTHMQENMQSLIGQVPDQAMRAEMSDYFNAIKS